jgi:hypothetical protein
MSDTTEYVGWWHLGDSQERHGDILEPLDTETVTRDSEAVTKSGEAVMEDGEDFVFFESRDDALAAVEEGLTVVETEIDGERSEVSRQDIHDGERL